MRDRLLHRAQEIRRRARRVAEAAGESRRFPPSPSQARRCAFGSAVTLALLVGAAGAAQAQTPLVYRIAVSGTVENGLAPYVARALQAAADAGASAAYLDIDTPGGRIDAAERIADAVGALRHSRLRLRESARVQRRAR